MTDQSFEPEIQKNSRPRTGPIIWGALLLAFCAWVGQRTLFPDTVAPEMWITAVVLGLGLLLLTVGVMVALRGDSDKHRSSNRTGEFN